MGKEIGVISTKKMAVNQKQFLLNAGFKVIDEDFISINPISFEIGGANDLLIFTSQNTVQNILKHKDKLVLKPVLLYFYLSKKLDTSTSTGVFLNSSIYTST